MHSNAAHGLVALTVALVAAIPVATGHATDLATNGDFADNAKGWIDNTGLGSDDLLSSNATMLAGWTSVPGSANSFWATTPNRYGLTQSAGNASAFWIDLTGEASDKPCGGIEQTIATTAGTTYALTFDFGSSTLYNGSGDAAAARTANVVGATMLASSEFTSAPNSTNEWTSESLTFPADGSSTTVSFMADSNYSYFSAWTSRDAPLPAGPGRSA